MPDIIDVSYSIGDQAAFLAGAGVKTVIRYYSRDTGRPAKRLSKAEADAFTAAGLRIGIVHEAKRGDLITSFTEDTGRLDAAYAREYGASIIGQPAGSAIYFAVDTDPLRAQIRDNVIPFFRGVAQAMAAANGQPVYRIGVYGSGAVCTAVSVAGLAELTWLAQPANWSGSAAYDAARTWSMKQLMPAKVGDIGCDPDVAGAAGDIGDFALRAPLTMSSASDTRMSVTARNGLRLRAGPGTNFDIIDTLRFGAQVRVLKKVDDWAQVDCQGDSAADGFVSIHYLATA